MTFLPQFVAPGQALLPRLFLLGVIFAVIGWSWMNVYGLFVTRKAARGAKGRSDFVQRVAENLGTQDRAAFLREVGFGGD